MEEEKKAEEKQTQAAKAQAGDSDARKLPIMTRSMMEACETCGDEIKSKVPEILPDPSWSTDRLIEASKDENMLTRSNAIMLMSKRSPQEVLEPLIEAMKDKEYVVKSNAMVAISSFGHQVLDRMISALSDSDPDIRAGAAWVLGELKDPKAIEPLERTASDEYPLARIQAKASLLAMTKGSKREEPS